jgi:hypothetical protein
MVSAICHFGTLANCVPTDERTFSVGSQRAKMAKRGYWIK